jgi:hypothetical protein
LRAWRRHRHRELAALHRSFGPAEAAAGEHRIREIRRRPKARNANVETLGPDGCDRHQGHPHHQVEIFLDPDRGRRQRLTGALKIVRRHCKAGAIPAKHERKFASFQCIGNGGDDRRTGHIDRLVTGLRNRPGRFHDIGDADAPVIRQRRIERRVH